MFCRVYCWFKGGGEATSSATGDLYIDHRRIDNPHTSRDLFEEIAENSDSLRR